MKTQFFALSLLFIYINGAAIDRVSSKILPSETTPCSMNASGAYLDIMLVIDTSANMGTPNLRKISTSMSLILSKFNIGTRFNITETQHDTRIAVITYDKQATIRADFSQIHNLNDLATILNGLSASNSQEANLNDGLNKAYYVKTNCSDVYDYNCTAYIPTALRHTAVMLFTASSNTPNISLIPYQFSTIQRFERATMIGINFNTADSALTNLLQNLTWSSVANASMYNFISTSNSLTRDLEWAIMQVNCFCLVADNVVYFDKDRNQFAKYAECLTPVTWVSAGFQVNKASSLPNSTITMCLWSSDEPSIPAYILTSERQKYIESQFMYVEIKGHEYPVYPYFFGLHKNSQSQWENYDYNLNEFPQSGYTNWANGNPGSDECTFLDSDDKKTLVWKTANCNKTASYDTTLQHNSVQSGINYTILATILCQMPACDASSFACCLDCLRDGGDYNEKQNIRSKNRKNLLMTMDDGKPVIVN